MRIKIKIGKEREEKHGAKYGIKRLNLLFPNSLLKSRLAVKIFKNNMERQIEYGKVPFISPELITGDLLKTCCAHLKRIIKQNGHFNLVEIEAADGTEVLIRV